MAREFGAVNVTIWQDADFRNLPLPAQHLYLLLWTHPDLSYCGVVDYRPGRLAKLADGLTAEVVELAAQCLEARHFLVIDRESEEVLVRSWMRWDGLMKQPRLAVSMAKAYASVASNLIRGVVVHEVSRIRDQHPELSCWGNDKVAGVLSQPSVSAKDEVSVSDPFGQGFTQQFTQWFTQQFGQRLGQTSPDVSVVVSVPPTPAPAPAPIAPIERASKSKRAQQLPDGWKPTRDDVAAIAAVLPDLDTQAEHEKFTDHFRANGKPMKDWSAAWRNWMRRAGEFAPTKPRSSADADAEWRESQWRAPKEPPPGLFGEDT